MSPNVALSSLSPYVYDKEKIIINSFYALVKHYHGKVGTGAHRHRQRKWRHEF